MKVFAVVAATLAVGSHAVATQDKTITKVVKVLQDMLAKSKQEGDEEREIFAKFKCFCDQNEAEKKQSIKDFGKEISVLSSKIEELQGSTGGLSTECAKLTADIAANEAAQDQARTIREDEHNAYVAEKADMEQAIDQMNQAIDMLSEVGADQTLGAAADHEQFMAGHEFLQSKSSKVRKALEAVSAFLNPAQSKSIQSFLQSRAPFTGSYSSQSGQIVGTLKSMRDTFEANLATAEATETQQVEAFDKLMETLEAAHTEMSDSLAEKQESMGGNDGDLSAKKEQLAEAKSQKENDEEYLAKLQDMCSEKTKEYNERKMLRANEDAAIAEAIAILNSDSAFESFGKTDATSTGATGFIQLRSRRVRVHGLTVAQKVRDVLLESKSPRVAKIASVLAQKKKAENVFETVLNMIDEMLEVIQEEGNTDKENLDWCNDERTQNHADLDDKINGIDSLNSEINDLDNAINAPETGLKDQIKATEESLKENIQSQKDQTKERKEENLLYQEDIKNLVAAEKILDRAIVVLKKYYDKLAQRMEAEAAGFLQKEDPDAPETWDNYGGQSSAGNDVIKMLEFIQEETKKEEHQAHADEESSQHSYEDSMQGLKDDEAADEESLAELQKTLADKEEELVLKHGELKATEAEKEAIEAYLKKIKPGCDFITTHFDERERNRATETTALNRAKDLIKDTPVYKNYVAEDHVESFGDCKEPCTEDEDHVTCKACMAKTSEPGYCAGHPGTKGC